MKIIITSASEIDLNGNQEVAFNIVKDDEVQVSGSLSGDVENLKEMLRVQLIDYEAKCKNENRLKEGDEIIL